MTFQKLFLVLYLLKLTSCITYSCDIKEHRVTTNGFPIKIKLLCYSCVKKGVSNLGVCFISQINSPGRNIIFVGGEDFLFDFVWLDQFKCFLVWELILKNLTLPFLINNHCSALIRIPSYGFLYRSRVGLAHELFWSLFFRSEPWFSDILDWWEH